MKALAALLVALLAGCSSMPSLQYCDQVEYVRNGADITLKAHCRAPVGMSPPGM
jgi:hypothetical protein